MKAGVLSHPRGLYVLFFTEMWERFSYYGMRALLVPYMLGYLLFSPASSSGTYKWYTSLVYLTPLAGGFISDRVLGLRTTIVVGGVLMAIGHFLMAFEPLPFFYAALAFLVCGNGFFKPNISTLVGKLYAPGDVRRDGAFTIFYMGINLGAFLAPLVCGALRQRVSPHAGFGAAGVGMAIGLTVFLLGQRRILADVTAAGNVIDGGDDEAAGGSVASADEEAAREGGFPGMLAKIFPVLIVLAGVSIATYYGLEVLAGREKPIALVMPIGFCAVFVFIARLLTRIRGAARDKSTVIFVLFVAAVLFWMTFEQAGNTLNIWAVTHTELHVLGWSVPAEWFQSVNALLIFLLGLPFAALWVALAKRGLEPPTPLKMAFGLALVALSFVPMVAAAARETATVSRVPLASLPPGVVLGKVDAGRLVYDESANELRVNGVLPPFAVNEVFAQSVPAERRAELHELGPREKATRAEALAPPELRTAMRDLERVSQGARVSGVWLLLHFLIATLGELCLSPVGLSMVTKLAPRRVASLFMGVWLLASSVAQYAGGTLGERWGKVPPRAFFETFVGIGLVGAVVLVLLVKPLRRLMHGVR